jgi:hypothetical protein
MRTKEEAKKKQLNQPHSPFLSLIVQFHPISLISLRLRRVRFWNMEVVVAPEVVMFSWGHNLELLPNYK